jgi:hypothetical protein
MKGIHARMVGFGLLLGFSLSCMGFTDYGEVHAMFTFTDLRLFLTFVAGVTLTGLGFLALRGGLRLSPRRLHKGSIAGGAVFGLGWALTGACPGVVFAQLGEGKALALVTLAGVLLGNWIYGKAHARWFRWDAGSCES